MGVQRIIVLAHDMARQRAAAYAGEAPGGTVVVFRDANRTGDQNAKFHAICSDLAKARLPWAGKPRDAAAWKVLLVSGHAAATKEGSEMVPGIEGEFVNVRESTAAMSKARGSSLIEYALAFCAMNGIALPDHATELQAAHAQAWT